MYWCVQVGAKQPNDYNGVYVHELAKSARESVSKEMIIKCINNCMVLYIHLTAPGSQLL